MNNNGENFISFLIGFIVGGLIGAAVALLYAPQSGEETRAQIKEKSIEIRDQASEQAAAYRAQAEKQISSLRQKVDELQVKLSKEVKVNSKTLILPQPPRKSYPANLNQNDMVKSDHVIFAYRNDY